MCNAKQAMHRPATSMILKSSGSRLQCNSKELGTLWDELKLGPCSTPFVPALQVLER